jgi:hypothetical protein
MFSHVAKSVGNLRKRNNYAKLSDVFTLTLYAILPSIINLRRTSKTEKALSRAYNLPKIIRATNP